jgi:DNA-binding response OmpR family regulator
VRALVAERSATTRRVVIRAMREVGIVDTLEFADTASALPALDADPGLVVAGWDLADDAGLDLVTAVRARDGGARACVLVVTERDRREDVERALGLGIQGYVLKPVAARDLADQLTAALRATERAAHDDATEPEKAEAA